MNLAPRLLSRYDLRVIGLILIFAYLAAILVSLFIVDDPVKDYQSFYTAALLAWQGNAALVYDLEGFAGQIHSFFEGDSYYPWFYPPTTLIAVTPLAWVPPTAGLLITVFGQLALFCWLACRFFGKPHIIVFALAGTGLLLNAIYTQMGTLWACLFLLAMQSLKEDRQIRAGLWLALLSMKPHYGLLIPVALVAAGKWRCIAVTCLLIAAMAIASLAIFGVETWLAFFESTGFSSAVVQNPSAYFGVDSNELTNLMSLVQSLGAPLWLGWVVQAAVALTCALAVYRTWRNPRYSFAWRVALLAMATFLSMPWSFTYDAPLLNLWLAFMLLALPGDRGLYQEKNYGLIILLWLMPFLVLTITLLNLLPDGMSNIGFLLPAWLMWKLRDQAGETEEPGGQKSP